MEIDEEEEEDLHLHLESIHATELFPNRRGERDTGFRFVSSRLPSAETTGEVDKSSK